MWLLRIQGCVCNSWPCVWQFRVWKWQKMPKYVNLICLNYYCYYYTLLFSSLVTGLLFPVLLVNQRWSLLLRLQVSDCSTFRIMCDVPRIAVFCSEPIECFPGTASKFFLKLLVTILMATIIIGIIIIIIIFINCNWVITRWQWLFYMYTNMEKS